MRRGRILLLGAILLAGCGGEPEGTLLVEIVTAQADGVPPPGALRLVGEDGRDRPLAPDGTRGEAGAVYAARAPAGRYTLAGTPPWGPVNGPKPLALAPGAVPARLAAGRLRSIYLAAPEGRRTEDALVRVPGEAGQPERSLRVERNTGSDGWMVLRFPESTEWGGTVRVAARFDDGTFAEPLRVVLAKDGTPVGISLQRAPVIALDVTVLGSRVPVAGSVLGLVVEDDGLEASRETPLGEAGRARIERFPLARGGARLSLGRSTWSLGADDVRLGDVRLQVPDLDAPPDPRAPEIEWDGGRPEDFAHGHFQWREERGTSYGIAPADEFARGLAPGRYRLLWLGPRTASPSEVLFEQPDRPASAPTRLRVSHGPVCRVQTTLGGTLPAGWRYAVLARRVEGQQAVLAQGFVVRNLSRPEQEMALPPGRYRFAVEVQGREGPPAEVTLAAPGARASVRLEAPR